MYIPFEKHILPYEVIDVHNLEFYPHLHPQVELLYVNSGVIDVCIDNITSTLNSGDLLIVFPNLIHSYKTKGKSLSTLLIIQLEYIREYTPQLTTMKPKSHFLYSNMLHKDIIKIMRMLKSSKFNDIHLLKGYLLVLIGRLLEKLTLVKTDIKQNTSLLSDVLMYLEQNYANDIQLENVARALGISKFSISRCFSTNIGASFNSYINGLRIQHAQSLLIQTNMSITEIAYTVGFQSISTFYRSFDEIVGEKPSTYRKRNQMHPLDN